MNGLIFINLILFRGVVNMIKRVNSGRLRQVSLTDFFYTELAMFHHSSGVVRSFVISKNSPSYDRLLAVMRRLQVDSANRVVFQLSLPF